MDGDLTAAMAVLHDCKTGLKTTGLIWVLPASLLSFTGPSHKAFLLFLPRARYLPPQGLCTGSSLYLRGFPRPCICMPPSLIFFKSLFKCHLLREAFPDYLV